jgi:ribosomal protein L11 methylase PrmA
VLALDGLATGERTIASLRRFGLPLVVGVEHREDAVGVPDAEINQIDWRDDFADARNQLAGLIDADWLLWIDADEELAAFDATEIAGLQAPVAAVWLNDRRGYTARWVLRLQRLGTDARWAEALVALDGIRFDSFASENSQQAQQDRSRLGDVAARAEATGTDGFAVALLNARSAEAKEHGSVAFMAWVRAFNHVQGGPSMVEGPDPRVEVAEWLCTYDYMTPALLLLDANSDIANLRFQVLTSILWSEDRFDENHFVAVAERLAGESFDRRYGAPHELIGVGRPKLCAAVEAHAWTRFDLKSRRRDRMEVSREGRYLVAPAELEHAPQAPVVIRVDAGLSFGGGDHPSSFLCLRALDWLARFRQYRQILDVGVGSGVLSIAALKTWCARVTAFDVNLFAVAKAAQNFRANHVAPRVRVSCEAGGISHRLPRGSGFELALVNLNYAELAAYAPALARAAMAHGTVVLSGLKIIMNAMPRTASCSAPYSGTTTGRPW